MLTITTIINLINIASLIIVSIAMIITGIIMYILIKIVRKYLKGEGSPPPRRPKGRATPK
jgi:heme/copper-type cytochrome/quinol oxidase subunit 2